MESMTGYTFTPCVGSFTSPDIKTPDRRDQRLLVFPSKDRDTQSLMHLKYKCPVREPNPDRGRANHYIAVSLVCMFVCMHTSICAC